MTDRLHFAGVGFHYCWKTLSGRRRMPTPTTAVESSYDVAHLATNTDYKRLAVAK